MNTTPKIENAKIENTMLGWEDHSILTVWLWLKLESGGQGFGGYGLDEPVHVDGKFLGRYGTAYGMRFIEGVMRAVGVDSWEKLKGSLCRVEADHNKIYRIGHFLENRWFDPKELLEQEKVTNV